MLPRKSLNPEQPPLEKLSLESSRKDQREGGRSESRAIFGNGSQHSR